MVADLEQQRFEINRDTLNAVSKGMRALSQLSSRCILHLADGSPQFTEHTMSRQVARVRQRGDDPCRI